MSSSWINKLNKSDSRLHKEMVVHQALTAATLGNENSKFFLEQISNCYNPYLTFGVKKIPNTVGIVDAENPWAEFQNLLNRLAIRECTGHAARDAIAALSERFDSDEWNTFLAPVLRRDLRAGISDKTFNKVCKKTKCSFCPVSGPTLRGKLYVALLKSYIS
jgi:DNA ligase-1